MLAAACESNPIMKDCFASLERNLHKEPRARRYSERLKQFCRYMAVHMPEAVYNNVSRTMPFLCSFRAAKRFNIESPTKVSVNFEKESIFSAVASIVAYYRGKYSYHGPFLLSEDQVQFSFFLYLNRLLTFFLQRRIFFSEWN
jgi:hypothetical protein